jgi:ABC-type proline/glycine betaine transport system substrate-binding protein
MKRIILSVIAISSLSVSCKNSQTSMQEASKIQIVKSNITDEQLMDKVAKML